MTTANGKHRSATGSMGRKIAALITAVATALGVAAVAAPAASADRRDALGPGCSWSDYGQKVQNCWINSPSMGQNIQVQIKRSNSDAAVYLLDGLRARDDWNAWTWQGNGAALFVNDDVNVVMPVGGAAQFYTDWEGPFTGTSTPRNPHWETFLTSELPAQLKQGFGISPNNNALVGLSMGGTAALTLGGYHRDQFKQVTALSPYTNTSSPAMYAALQAAMVSGSPGALTVNMWGLPMSPAQLRNDPTLNVGNLRGMPVYLSAASGIPDLFADGPNFFADPLGGLSGIGLEALAKRLTVSYDATARLAGVNITSNYPMIGVHNWTLWNPELANARPSILKALGVRYWAEGPQW